MNRQNIPTSLSEGVFQNLIMRLASSFDGIAKFSKNLEFNALTGRGSLMWLCCFFERNVFVRWLHYKKTFASFFTFYIKLQKTKKQTFFQEQSKNYKFSLSFHSHRPFTSKKAFLPSFEPSFFEPTVYALRINSA